MDANVVRATFRSALSGAACGLAYAHKSMMVRLPAMQGDCALLQRWGQSTRSGLRRRAEGSPLEGAACDPDCAGYCGDIMPSDRAVSGTARQEGAGSSGSGGASSMRAPALFTPGKSRAKRQPRRSGSAERRRPCSRRCCVCLLRGGRGGALLVVRRVVCRPPLCVGFLLSLLFLLLLLGQFSLAFCKFVIGLCHGQCALV